VRVVPRRRPDGQRRVVVPLHLHAVATGCGLLEGDLHQPLRFSFPCFFAYRSPRWKMARPSGIATTAMRSSGQTLAHARPAPLTIDSRQPRSAYVAGEIFAIACIHSGITDTG